MKNKHFSTKEENKIIKKYSDKKFSKDTKNKMNKTFEILKQVDEYYGPYFW